MGGVIRAESELRLPKGDSLLRASKSEGHRWFLYDSIRIMVGKGGFFTTGSDKGGFFITESEF